MIFIFDVDGTLTPSRSTIDENFGKWFRQWVLKQQNHGNQIWLITGSDLPKTQEQLGNTICNQVNRLYNCMGNTLYKHGEFEYQNEFNPPQELINYLKEQIDSSNYPYRYGQHIEHRPGMLNFSIVGRGAVGDQRTEYYMWDQGNKERETIATEINTRFKSENIVALVGGETGLDISYAGWDKGQIFEHIDQRAVFFGDRMDPAGNDYPLSSKLEKVGYTCHHVKDWNESFDQLKQYI